MVCHIGVFCLHCNFVITTGVFLFLCAQLTAEDEERRRKRRERNKIAATKCRLKKREKTTNLMQVSTCASYAVHLILLLL